MTFEQVDHIVISELQDAYERNVTLGRYEGVHDMGPDEQLCDAIETVLEYFMAPSEYEAWKRKHGRNNS
jgi:hypothetical protein